jgi:hypothetical protein
MISLLKVRIVSYWLLFLLHVQELILRPFASCPYPLKSFVFMIDMNFVMWAVSGNLSPNDGSGSDIEERGLSSSSSNDRMTANLWTDDVIKNSNHAHWDFPLLPSIRLT